MLLALSCPWPRKTFEWSVTTLYKRESATAFPMVEVSGKKHLVLVEKNTDKRSCSAWPLPDFSSANRKKYFVFAHIFYNLVSNLLGKTSSLFCFACVGWVHDSILMIMHSTWLCVCQMVCAKQKLYVRSPRCYFGKNELDILMHEQAP